ncbi:LuxR C-terminal-related transcriptional regulator [Amycolatopsis lurida]
MIEGVRAWLAREPRVRVVAAVEAPGELGPESLAGADIALLDLNLGGQTRFDNIGRLVGAGLKVIVYSQFTDRDTVLRVLSSGAREFVAKNEGGEHLLNVVLAVATDEPYVTPTTAGALIADDATGRPRLSERERTALLLWFQSKSKAAVARRMRVSPHTVDMFIRRARLKYSQAGRSAHTKSDLLARAIEDELVRPEDLLDGTTGGD